MGGRLQGALLRVQVRRGADGRSLPPQGGVRVRPRPVLGVAVLLPGLRLVEVVLPLPLRAVRVRLSGRVRRLHRLREEHETGARTSFMSCPQVLDVRDR